MPINKSYPLRNFISELICLTNLIPYIIWLQFNSQLSRKISEKKGIFWTITACPTEHIFDNPTSVESKQIDMHLMPMPQLYTLILSLSVSLFSLQFIL